jgi:hypothetical protein
MAMVKVIEVWNDPQGWETQINSFNKTEGIRVVATQTHVNPIPKQDGSSGLEGVQYIAIIYYNIMR